MILFHRKYYAGILVLYKKVSNAEGSQKFFIDGSHFSGLFWEKWDGTYARALSSVLFG
jgi:hypothetical protein